MQYQQKLDDIEKRYNDLTDQMADPAVIGDPEQYRKVTKAHSELGEVVAKYREWKKLADALSQARAMLGACETFAASQRHLQMLLGGKPFNEDLVDPGRTGWIIPIRTPEAAITHLDWCDQHRPELAEIVQEAYESDFARDWSAVATDFVDSLEATRAPKAST